MAQQVFHRGIILSLLALIGLLRPGIAHAQPNLYLCGTDEELQGLPSDLLKTNSFRFIPIIYQFAIDPDDKVDLNGQLLIKEIRKYFPNKTDTGICVLDWEGKTLQLISDSSVNSAAYKKGIDLFIKALQLAKKERPRVRFGFFGINRVNIYQQDDAWQQWNDKLLPVYKESDILFPQMYHYYPYEQFSKTKDSTYMTEHVQQMIRYGQQLHKPVMAFIWHRYFESMGSIPANEYYDHVLFAASGHVKGKRLDGIVLWTGDGFWISSGHQKVMSEKGAMSSSGYRKKTLTTYFDLSRKAILRSNKKFKRPVRKRRS